jgi:hypothetical protein
MGPENGTTWQDPSCRSTSGRRMEHQRIAGCFVRRVDFLGHRKLFTHEVSCIRDCCRPSNVESCHRGWLTNAIRSRVVLRVGQSDHILFSEAAVAVRGHRAIRDGFEKRPRQLTLPRPADRCQRPVTWDSHAASRNSTNLFIRPSGRTAHSLYAPTRRSATSCTQGTRSVRAARLGQL